MANPQPQAHSGGGYCLIFVVFVLLGMLLAAGSGLAGVGPVYGEWQQGMDSHGSCSDNRVSVAGCNLLFPGHP